MFCGFIIHINDIGKAFCLKIMSVYDSFIRICYVLHGCDTARGYTLHRGPQIKLSTPLSYTCNRTVKTYGGVEIKILLLLPSALNGS